MGRICGTGREAWFLAFMMELLITIFGHRRVLQAYKAFGSVVRRPGKFSKWRKEPPHVT